MSDSNLFTRSAFGEYFSQSAPILSLMQDLGDALNNNPDMLFLGGGNPAIIPEAAACFKKHFQALGQQEGELENLLGVYQSPQGDERTIEHTVEYFRKQCGWPIDVRNIAFVGGSQTAFYILLNLFAGRSSEGSLKKILLPLVPEYLGYASQVPEPNVFETCCPDIHELTAHRFKYRLALNSIKPSSGIGAMLCSRPTNPTGNVLTDEEIEALCALASQNRVPFILDNAYGYPFPNLLSTKVKPNWHANLVQVFSLSKLGLPGLRTAVVVAAPDIIEQVVRANIVLSLANSNLGAKLLSRLIVSGDLMHLSENVLPSFYSNNKKILLAYLEKALVGLNYKIHEPEGAFFLWLWLPDLSVSSDELYEQLKAQGVLVMSGMPFFFDQQDWCHASQCLRLSYCQPAETLEKAATLIAQSIRSYSS